MKFSHTFEEIVSVDNLLAAWSEFVLGKRRKSDVQEFYLRLMDNLFALHVDLVNHTYRHGSYQAFNISDPKPRHIHKASVRDRLLHHAVYRILYPFFDTLFIYDSYSCRLGKGTHKAIARFRNFAHQVSKNNHKTCRVLKCDIRKFFASIDHDILKDILEKYIEDEDIRWLLGNVIDSFSSDKSNVGLPLGNLTSQLLVNVYMNEFDQFVKHQLREKYYIRYADDFVFMSADREHLEKVVTRAQDFLRSCLGLELHQKKTYIKTLASGLDFLGWVHFPQNRILRTSSKKRMMKRIKENPKPETLASYRGLLKHGHAHKLAQEALSTYWLSSDV